MKMLPPLLILLVFPFFLLAQFTEDFSGDTLNTNIWVGDTANFIVNGTEELQLLDEDPFAGNSRLVAAVNTEDSTQWEFYYRQDFSASGSNFSRIYLSANTDLLNDELNGYFIQLGGITGNADRLELYRQDGNDTELLISGKDSMLAATPSLGRVQVSRNDDGLWRLAVDYTGGNNFEVEGTAIDNTYPFANFFGITCRYSTTRFDKFFFDDIRISPLFVDTRAPQVSALQTLDDFQIELLFDEFLDPLSAENPSNYALNPALNIQSASLNPANSASVRLTLSQALTSQETYTLSILGVEDQNGNAQNNQVLEFTYYKIEEAQAYDILINEIYADFNPSLGLPETEYLELYNRSEKIIDLEDFMLEDNGNDLVFFPSRLFFPGEYLILYEAGEADFSAFGDSLPLDQWLTLGNTFDELALSNASGQFIHTVHYQKSWYQDNERAEGGWSLELINPRAPCGFGSNWRASESLLGGTPGQENSIFAEAPSAGDLEIFRAYPLFGGNRLEIIFTQSLDPVAATDIANYNIDGIGITAAEIVPGLFNRVTLQLDAILVGRQIYTLEVNTGLKDCTGLPIPGNLEVRFGLPEAYEPGEIIINEILFNPQTGGVDFLELYNRSEKVVNISNLFVANRDDSLQIDQIKPVGLDYLLLPGEYVVLTSDPEDIKNRYVVENPKAFLTMSLPTFADKEGSAILFFNQGSETVFVDEFSYREDYHNALLQDKNGVSLERIFPDGPSQDPENWHSAAQRAGYATPTYLNSQDGGALGTTNDLITLVYKTFSPDSDGFRDFLSIQYQTPETGYLANIRIFDTRGRLIRDLSQNELLGTSGILQWDGTDAEGNKARMGIYLLWVELFNPNGDVQYFKESCVLAGQLN